MACGVTTISAGSNRAAPAWPNRSWSFRRTPRSAWYIGWMDPADLVRSPRWSPLARFAERWYAEPLGSAGVCEADLAREESRLGSALPPALREWFTLVGHRLQFCGQDIPTRLEDLARAGGPRDGRVVVWQENQYCWLAEVELGPSGSDGSVVISNPPGEAGQHDRLERALLGMVCSDTLVAVWCGNSGGPLGALRPGVVGGYPQESMPGTEARFEALPVLDFPNTPNYDGRPFRGHETLVIRASGGGWEWMAADEAAHAEARRLLALDEQGGTLRLVVLFDPLPPVARPALQRWLDAGQPLGGAGHLGVATLPEGLPRVWLEFDTRDPARTLQALFAQLPPEAAGAARAGYRPEHTTRFEACWPPGAATFALPPDEERYP